MSRVLSLKPGVARVAVRALVGCLVMEALVGALLLTRPLYARTQSVRSAVCQDAYIDRMYNEIGRVPLGSGMTGECNARLYGSTWSSYDDLKQKFRAYQRTFTSTGWVSGGNTYTQTAGCRDQAVTDAVIAHKAPSGGPGTINNNRNYVRPLGSGELGECNMYLWGAGTWNGTADLRDRVNKGFRALTALGYAVGPLNQLLKDQRPVSPLFVGPPDAIAVIVKVNGVDTARVIAADGYTVNSRYIPAATAAQRSQFTVHSLNNGTYIALPR